MILAANSTNSSIEKMQKKNLLTFQQAASFKRFKLKIGRRTLEATGSTGSKWIRSSNRVTGKWKNAIVWTNYKSVLGWRASQKPSLWNGECLGVLKLWELDSKRIENEESNFNQKYSWRSIADYRERLWWTENLNALEFVESLDRFQRARGETCMTYRVSYMSTCKKAHLQYPEKRHTREAPLKGSPPKEERMLIVFLGRVCTGSNAEVWLPL